MVKTSLTTKLRRLRENTDSIREYWEVKMVETMTERKWAGIPITELQESKINAIYAKYFPDDV